MQHKKDTVLSLKDSPDAQNMLSRNYWTLMDGLWVLLGYVVVEQVSEKTPISSLTRDQKLFSLVVMWETDLTISPVEPHFYEDIVLIDILEGKKLMLSSMKENLRLREEITESSNNFFELKALFESTANPKYCELWYDPSKPFHLLSEWNRDYLFDWASEQSLSIQRLGDSIKLFPRFFENKQSDDADNSFKIGPADLTVNVKSWKVKESMRDKDYGPQLNRLLRDFYNRGVEPPDEKDVLEIWRGETPWGIYEVTQNSFRYKLRNGKMSNVVMARHLKIAIQGRIIWID